jgi:hypothetical protein
MSATMNLIKKSLQIFLETDEGKTTKMSFSKLNLAATADQLLAAANALGELQTLTVKEYRVVDTNALSE